MKLDSGWPFLAKKENLHWGSLAKMAAARRRNSAGDPESSVFAPSKYPERIGREL